MPEKRSAATVNLAVQSIRYGRNTSPNGTAKNRNASGNVSLRATFVPSTAITARSSSAVIENCATTFTSARRAASHMTPAIAMPASAQGAGRGATDTSVPRILHTSQSTMGTTTKPWANVSLFAQVRAMLAAVDAYSPRIARMTTASATTACRHVARASGAVARRADARRGSERLDAMFSRCPGRASPEAPHDVRAEAVRNADRQPLPQRDERAVLGVRRIVLRHRVALVEPVFVVQRRGLESPVLLEREGPGVALAAAVVEQAAATRDRMPHQLPVLEIVGGEVARRLVVARVVRQHLVAEVERQHARQ